MSCKVISISRALAAQAEDIGHAVAGELGFCYVDDEIVTWAADKAGVSPATIERVERTPPLFDRILRHMGNAPAEFGAYLPPPVQESPAYEAVISQVIRDRAQLGDVVIVAHGASIALAGLPGLLRVLVTASPQVRAHRVAAQENIDERKAKKLIEDSDRQRRDYLQRLYNVPHELPTHYDIVLNTDVLTPEAAAGIISNAASA